jgi:hypothetical protein
MFLECSLTRAQEQHEPAIAEVLEGHDVEKIECGHDYTLALVAD